MITGAAGRAASERAVAPVSGAIGLRHVRKAYGSVDVRVSNQLLANGQRDKARDGGSRDFGPEADDGPFDRDPDTWDIRALNSCGTSSRAPARRSTRRPASGPW